MDVVRHRGCNGVHGEEVNVVSVGGTKNSSVGDKRAVGLGKVWRRDGILDWSLIHGRLLQLQLLLLLLSGSRMIRALELREGGVVDRG